ncbi:MAG: hypothetical protein HY553_08495 [Elusimicrobia bacterium]|nr:hypothetical protein [Elusimicrobiota bacterium]
MVNPVLAALAVLAHAQSPAFETQVGAAFQAFHRGLQDQRAGAVDEAARRAQSLEGSVGRLRWNVQDVRRRAGWIDPRRGRDWFFEADVRRLRHDLQDLAFQAQALEADVKRLARDTPADPELAAAAARLVSAARGLRVEAGRLADDGRWASHELRRAGYGLEGEDFRRHTAEALMSAFNLEDAAQRLERRTRG